MAGGEEYEIHLITLFTKGGPWTKVVETNFLLTTDDLEVLSTVSSFLEGASGIRGGRVGYITCLKQ